jgi:hypothetical protein
LKAAETLPRIPGLEIKNSKAAPASEWIRVELEIAAAGQTETYSYLCATCRRKARQRVRVARCGPW